MISSVRKVILDSITAYTNTPRKRWVIEWPGQVTLCVSSIFWTQEVVEAMKTPTGMKVRTLTAGRVFVNSGFLLHNY